MYYGFESPEALETLIEELTGHEGPVELSLTGDFFDFLPVWQDLGQN